MAVELMMVKHLGALRPADPQSEEALRSLKEGDTVKVTMTRSRNLGFHRRFWLLAHKVFENMDEERQDHYKTPEGFVAALKVATGHVDIFYTKKGEPIYVPRSIAFHRMDQTEFSAFFNRCCDLIVRHILPGLDRETLVREIEELAGVRYDGRR